MKIMCNGILEDGTMKNCPLRNQCKRYLEVKEEGSSYMVTPGYYNTKTGSFNCNLFIEAKEND